MKPTLKLFFPFIVIFLVMLLIANSKPGVFVSNLQIKEGNPTILSFNLKQTFDTERECIASTTVSANNKALSTESKNLGLLPPHKITAQVIQIDFPHKGVDFRVDIDCSKVFK